MALGPYETALGWLGSENRKSSIRVFFDYNQLCTSMLELSLVTIVFKYLRTKYPSVHPAIYELVEDAPDDVVAAA